MRIGIAASAVVLAFAGACGSSSPTSPDMSQMGVDHQGGGMDVPQGGQDVPVTPPSDANVADSVPTSPDAPCGANCNVGGIPSQSSTVAINPGKDRLWVVYPDTNQVGVFKIAADENAEAAILSTGKEPWSVAFSGDGKAYIANFGDNTVSCFKGADATTRIDIPVGNEPIAIAPSPAGDKLYVANLADNSVSVISVTGTDCTGDMVTSTITNVPDPIAIATAGNQVFVTRFRAGFSADDPTKTEANDNGRRGEVTTISADTNAVTGTVILAGMVDTGFSIPPTMDGGMPTTTGAFPNLLAGIAFKGGKGYVASIGTSAKGPLNFKFDIQAFVSVFDPGGTTGTTFNLNKGSKLDKTAAAVGQTQNFPFLTNPWAITFRSDDAPVGYISASAVDQVIRFQIEAATGNPLVETAAVVKRIKTGKNPRGMVVNSDNTRLYIMNYISRTVTVVDLSNFSPLMVGGVDKSTMSGTITEPPITDTVHQGNLQFHSAIGANYEAPDDPGAPGGVADPVKKDQFALSNSGWMACASCHPFGRDDGVTWSFNTGPRRTLPMTSSFSKETDVTARKIRLLNWTALNDEVQDFENNTKNVAGGRGLIVDATGTPVAAAPFINAAMQFVMNTGRPNLKVMGLDQDNMEAWARTLRAPTAPSGLDPAQVTAGRALFASANCVACHGGPHFGGTIRTWDKDGANITNAPALTDFFNDMVGATPFIQYVPALRNVGSFDATNPLEKRQDGVAGAQGDHGFNPPSLLGVANRAPYFHHGQARTLEDVINVTNVQHIQAGNCGNPSATTPPGCTPNAQLLANATDFAALITFVKSIDDTTVPCSLPPTDHPASDTELAALCP